MMELALFLGPAILVWALEGLFGRFLISHNLVRKNYAGKPIPTSYGLLLLMSALPFYLLSYSLPGSASLSLRFITAAIPFCLLGFADDRWGDRSVGGLKGHFNKLLQEKQLTTGAMKALGGGWIAFMLAISLFNGNPIRMIVTTLMIALMANTVNLVDTRPMRALAIFYGFTALSIIVLMIKGSGIPPSFWVLPGAGMGYAPVERARQGMIGDAGSNLLGGVLGLSLAIALNLAGMVIVVLLLIGFHLFTERRSFNEYIRERPKLNAIDLWIQGKPLTGAELIISETLIQADKPKSHGLEE